ncbi:hypothetical protein SATMO3_31150 [Sporomusa aerivorans]
MCKKIILVLFGIIICFHAGVFAAANEAKGKNGADKKIIVRYGMKGDDVREVQERLIKLGFLQGKADGIFGKATYAAIKSFQVAAKLNADGIVGVKTMEALKKYKPPRKDNKSKSAQSVIPKPNPSSKQPKPVPGRSHQSPPAAGIPANWYPIHLEATAYTRFDEGCTDFTYRGNYVRRGLAAVDPAVIPLGSKLYIPDYGYAVADDIGGVIQGYKIDLAMETLDEAFAYGRRHITAYLINE